MSALRARRELNKSSIRARELDESSTRARREPFRLVHSACTVAIPPSFSDLDNALFCEIAAVSGVTGFLSFIGKLTVIVLTGGSFYYVMNDQFPNECKSLMVPTMMVLIIATGVAMMFFEV